MTKANFPKTSNSNTRTGGLQSQAMLSAHLGTFPLFEGVDEEILKALTTALQLRTAERGQIILNKGSIGNHLLFLISGRLQAIEITEEGHQIGLSFLTEGDFFGELAVIDGLLRSATVIACEASLYALLPRSQALALIHNNPLIAERVLRRLAASVRKASDFRAILGIPNAFQRVYAFLDYLAKKNPGGLVTIDSLPTQHEIAIMINTSRETVSRAIRVLTQQGIVEKDLKRLIVRQPEALRDAMNAFKQPLVQLSP